MSGPVVEARGVVKRYPGGVVALAGVDVRAEPGGVTVVAGPSGSGKTTLLRILGGFLDPDEGGVYFDGSDVTGLPPWERRAVILSQRPVLLPHMTVEGNLVLAAESRGLGRGEAVEEARRLARLLGIEGVLGRRPGELSGGQLQRASLAAALAAGPRLLLLDEPFAHLDQPLRERLRLLVARIAVEEGLTVVQVTHDQDEALEVASTLYILVSGRVAARGDPWRLYAEPPSFEAAVFLGHNVSCGPPLAPEGGAATFPPDAVALNPGGDYVVVRVARRRGYWLVEARGPGGLVRGYLRSHRPPARTGDRVGVEVEWGLRLWPSGSCGRLGLISGDS